MSKSLKSNQPSQPDPTAWVQTENESLATNKAAVAIPYSFGQSKTVGRWITPIYGQRIVEVKNSGGGKGGKGGGSSTKKTYYGTIACALGTGPAWSAEWIIVNGIKAFEGGLMRPSGADYSDINLVGFGAARLYWGTETQVADPTLSAYAVQPAYRGTVYLVLLDCAFGENEESNAPVIEAGLRRLPQQSIITGAPAENDGAFTASPLAVTAEALSAWDWVGLSSAKINSTTFQNTADALHALRASGADPDRSAVAVAPLYTEQIELKAALASLSSISKAWLRLGLDGRIEAGYWKRGGSITCSALTINDLSEEPEINAGEADKLPNSFVVEYTDAFRHHKSNSITANNTAGIKANGRRQQTAKRPELLLDEQARVIGAELIRENSVVPIDIKLAVRRGKAVNPDGSAIREGDYFTYPIQLVPGDPADVRLFRVTRREFDVTGPVTLMGELETNGELQAVTPVEVDDSVALVTPPLNYRRTIAISRKTTDDVSPVATFAARVDNLVAGFRVMYCATSTGDYATLGVQGSFALPLSLAQAFDVGDSTIRVKLLPTTGSGINLRRDAQLLQDWQGGDTEARNDTLVMLVLKKDGTGAVVFHEFVSVAGAASAVATDTYDVPVLRGRRATAEQDFNAGSFPDAWSSYECWLILSSAIQPMIHADFVDLFGTSTPAYFRYVPFGTAGDYDPDVAYNEYQRRNAGSIPLAEFVNQTSNAAQPTDTFIFPATIPEALNSALGQTAYTILLSSEAMTISCAADGTPNGGELGVGGRAFTDITVLKGAVQISPVPSSPGAGQFSLTIGTTTGATVTKFSDFTARVDAMSASSASIQLILNLEGLVTVTKIFTVTKTPAGASGSGTSGNHTERRYKRSDIVPGTPTGDNPSGWTVAQPSGTQALWAVDGVKTPADTLVGSWSTPVRVSGQIVFYTHGNPNTALAGYSVSENDGAYDLDDGNKYYRYNGTAWVDTQRVLALPDFGLGFSPVSLVTSLPSPTGYTGAKIVFNSTDGKLYRYASGAWTSATPATDVTGTLVDAQLSNLSTGKLLGTIADSQIAALSATKISGTLSDSQLAAIAAAKITGTLSDSQLAAISAAKITGTLTDAQLSAIASTKITGTLTDSQLAAIGAAKITGQIVGTQITNGSISTAKIAAGAVTASEIAANTITASQIAAGAITSTTIAAGAITTAKLAAGAVTANEIAANTITAAKIAAGTISATEIASGAITTAKLAAGAVTATELAAGAVTAGKIAAGAIVAGDIAAGAITTPKLAAGAVTATTIAAGAITASKLMVVPNDLIQDPFFQDPTLWHSYDGTTEEAINASGAGWKQEVGGGGWLFAGQPYAIVAAGRPGSWSTTAGHFLYIDSPYAIPVKPNTVYEFAVDVVNASNRSLSFDIYAFEADRVTGVGALGSTTIGAGSGDSFARVQFTTQSAARFLRPRFLVNSGSTLTGYVAINKVILREAGLATSIVDGVITTNKIAANAITTNKLAAGAVTANEISANTITAGQIAAGAINATTVGANQIITTSANITNGTITNGHIVSLDAQKITSGSLTAQVSITSGGYIEAGSGYGYFKVNTSQFQYGSLLITPFLGAGTGINIAVGSYGAQMYAYTGNSEFSCTGPSGASSAMRPSGIITNGTFDCSGATTLNTLSTYGAISTSSSISASGSLSGASLNVGGGSISGGSIYGSHLNAGSGEVHCGGIRYNGGTTNKIHFEWVGSDLNAYVDGTFVGKIN